MDKISEAQRKLSTLLPFGMRLGLERIRHLLMLLENPQDSLRVIHVAGTNGKGSVCRYLYEVLEANGYRTGLFTSPYLESFGERIEYHGQQISGEDLLRCTNRVMAAIADMKNDGWDSPTEFEAITAVAMLYFHEKCPDFVILEVGLGGRADSTNVIAHPLVSIITSISMDHMDRLGNTLAQIAREKAGIIKEGIPVISAVTAPEAAKVIAREAYQKHCAFYDASRLPRKIRMTGAKGTVFDTQIGDTAFPGVSISMAGRHQVDNAVCALAAIEFLRRSDIINVDRPALDAGMKAAVQKGRFEVFPGTPCWVLDGAHNPGGMAALVQTMQDCFPQAKTLTILGILADKAVSEMLDLAVSVGTDFIAAEPDHKRKLAADVLAAGLRQRGRHCLFCGGAADAWNRAKQIEQNYDVILAAGSLYLIGDIRRRILCDRTTS